MSLSIVFEGPEGVGKTTHAAFLNKILIERGFKTLLNREPGGTEIGEKVREILLSDKFKDIDPLSQVLLFAVPRNELMVQKTRPFLKENPNGIVIQDRCYPSTFALQTADGADMKFIRDIQNPFMWFPDLFVFYDLPPEESIIRVLADEKQRETNWRDCVSLDTYRQIRINYLNIYKEQIKRSILIDGYKEPWSKIGEVIQEMVNVGSRISNNQPLIDENHRQELSKLLNQKDLIKNLWKENEEQIKIEKEGKGENYYSVDELFPVREQIRKDMSFASENKLRSQMYDTWAEFGFIQPQGKERSRG